VSKGDAAAVAGGCRATTREAAPGGGSARMAEAPKLPGRVVQWDTSVHDWLEGRGPRLYLVGR